MGFLAQLDSRYKHRRTATRESWISWLKVIQFRICFFLLPDIVCGIMSLRITDFGCFGLPRTTRSCGLIDVYIVFTDMGIILFTIMFSIIMMSLSSSSYIIFPPCLLRLLSLLLLSRVSLLSVSSFWPLGLSVSLSLTMLLSPLLTL